MIINLLGYTVVIRKQKGLNPRDCQGYKRQCDWEKEIVTENLRLKYGKKRF